MRGGFCKRRGRGGTIIQRVVKSSSFIQHTENSIHHIMLFTIIFSVFAVSFNIVKKFDHPRVLRYNQMNLSNNASRLEKKHVLF